MHWKSATDRTYLHLFPHTTKEKNGPFHIIKVGLTRDREELYDRINRRVDQMMQEGLLEEVRSVLPYRHLNSLNTVGYKELFKYLDGEWELPFAIEKIKTKFAHLLTQTNDLVLSGMRKYVGFIRTRNGDTFVPPLKKIILSKNFYLPSFDTF